MRAVQFYAYLGPFGGRQLLVPPASTLARRAGLMPRASIFCAGFRQGHETQFVHDEQFLPGRVFETGADVNLFHHGLRSVHAPATQSVGEACAEALADKPRNPEARAMWVLPVPAPSQKHVPP